MSSPANSTTESMLRKHTWGEFEVSTNGEEGISLLESMKDMGAPADACEALIAEKRKRMAEIVTDPGSEIA